MAGIAIAAFATTYGFVNHGQILSEIVSGVSRITDTIEAVSRLE
jgi:hypothetical protein